jgi:putative ABC transport system ATP-binding protein
MSEAITIRSVTKNFREGSARTLALAGVDMRVNTGEMVLMMGPSGSGKTTLLSIMGCILRPTSGQVFIHGKDVTALQEKDLPAVRLRHIGFVFQGFNLFPTLTACENVELTLKLKGWRGHSAKDEARRLLGLVGLEAKCDAFPSDISGGQKQRVAIARAVAGGPEILLADEPTAALDTQSGKTVVEMMRRLAQSEGKAVVIVTHDPRLSEYADRMVHLEDGRITDHGLEQALIPNGESRTEVSHVQP